MLRLRSSFFNNCSSPLDVSDRYSNLKAAWDSLMEAASHGHSRSFQVAVMVVLEQLKREELKKQNKKNE
jgi:RNAse (barnase) inhibitor barstar